MVKDRLAPIASARRRMALLLGSAAVFAPMLAPTLSVAADADTAPTVSEIVITAQKRSEDIKSVPISVSVLSGADLKDKRITDYDDLSRIVPGLSFNAVAGEEGRTNIVIRGVSSTSGASTVGLYLDDVSITIPNLYRDGSIELRLPDIDRIEVLRGPQGTLYGDSSEGGTIRYLTQTPNMTTFSGAATGDAAGVAHGGGDYAVSGMVNIPVIKDVLAVRASVNYVSDSGWIDHYTQGGVLDRSRVNGENSLTLHAVA